MAARENHDIIGGSKRFQSEAAEVGGVRGGREGDAPPILVGDIGATNARFGIDSPAGPAAAARQLYRRLPSRRFCNDRRRARRLFGRPW